MGEHHEGRHEGGAQLRDDDPAIQAEVRGPVDLRGLQDLVVDAAQAGGATVTEFQARHILIRAGAGDDSAAKARADALRSLAGSAAIVPIFETLFRQ